MVETPTLRVLPALNLFGKDKELLQLPSETWLYSLAVAGQERESPHSSGHLNPG